MLKENNCTITDLEENVYIPISKKELEFIVSGLRLHNNAKGQLIVNLTLDNYKKNERKIKQLEKETENISNLIEKYNNILYGGIFE